MDEERVRTALWIEALYCREEEAAEYYYDLDAAGLRGDDPVEDLLDRIDVASAGWHRRGAPIDALASTAQLFSGLRGTGKTTALVRTAEALRERGHHVILVDAKRFHELSLPLDADGLLLLLFAGLGSSERGVSLAQRAWDKVRPLIAAVDPSGGKVELDLTFVKFAATLKANRRLKHRLDLRAASDQEEAKDVLHMLARMLAEDVLREDGGGVALIIDSLEKLGGATPEAKRNNIAVAQAAFSETGNLLHLPGIHCIYTVPPILAVQGSVPAAFEGNAQMLRAVKVYDLKTGKRQDEGIDGLRALLERRIDVRALFGQGERLAEFIRMSGGHVQDLLRMAARAISRHRKTRQPLPVGDEPLRRTVGEFSAQRMPMELPAAELLEKVRAEHRIKRVPPDLYPFLLTLLHESAILAYPDDPEWYDAHPLAAASLDASPGRQVWPFGAT